MEAQVSVDDACADSDCDGCYAASRKNAGFSQTLEVIRWGVGFGDSVYLNE
jgi:hypothetical protein